MDPRVAAKNPSLPLATPTDLGPNATKDIAAALAALLADVFTLYLKTKNFHWHNSGPHFRDYHLLLDEQGEQIFAMTDVIAERAQDRRHDLALRWTYLAPAAVARQRRRFRLAGGHAGRTSRRQQAARRKPAAVGLQGTYGGVTVDASVGIGGGANILVGGTAKTLSLQPVSIDSDVGVNLAVGVTALKLRLAN